MALFFHREALSGIYVLTALRGASNLMDLLGE
jgi:hypothetical protein